MPPRVYLLWADRVSFDLPDVQGRQLGLQSSLDPLLNLELNVRCDPAGVRLVRDRALAGGIAACARLRQIDTYFVLATGRLKRRQTAPAAGFDRSASSAMIPPAGMPTNRSQRRRE